MASLEFLLDIQSFLCFSCLLQPVCLSAFSLKLQQILGQLLSNFCQASSHSIIINLVILSVGYCQQIHEKNKTNNELILQTSVCVCV